MPPRSPNWIDFKSARQSVSLESLLSRYGVQMHPAGKHTLRGCCPLPTHDPAKKAPSFIVNTAKNVWSCHSMSCAKDRGGKIGGNALDFVAAMEQCSIVEAGRRMIALSATLPPPTKPAPKQEGREENQPLRFQLRGVEGAHPYLTERSIKPETAAIFGVGFYGQPGLMHGRVVIPIHNESGRLVAYAGRSIDGADPKYRFPTGFHKSLELFNLHRVVGMRCREVIMVEGFFDCLQVHQAGFQNVCALMGRTLSETQMQKLTSHFDQVTLMLDGDPPGREATRKIAGQLEGRVAVQVINVPEGKQPDELGAAVVRNLLEPQNQRPGIRHNLAAVESPSLQRTSDEAKLEL